MGNRLIVKAIYPCFCRQKQKKKKKIVFTFGIENEINRSITLTFPVWLIRQNTLDLLLCGSV
jgi:hypothetical protein